ncbi:uncharacterized protein PFLUO_LOCUS1418 [Penicillium psychrofluorescens]|uniref:uncharacterized protein n=1 Tax=Penicillium psychrofluorescens TaxID=3158075 RepID=UPI003CCDCA39
MDSQSTPATASTGIFMNEVNPGYSLCPQRMKHGQGTFGGWIELRNPKSGKWVPFGITCSHCVFPPDTDLSPEEIQVVQRWKESGFPFNNDKASQLLMMDSPSRRGVKREIENLARRIDAYQNQPPFPKVEEAKARGDFVIPEDERQWKVASDMLAKLKEQRDTGKEFFHKNRFVFGPVVAASGLQERPMKTTLARDPTALLSIIDWALVKPQNRSVGTNNVAAHRSLGVSKLNGFSLCGIQNGDELFKVGCATGFTGGIYSGLQTIYIATRLVDGREMKIKTWEHTILARSLSQVVVEQGDSGSLVFNRLGAVVGMCFGGTYYGDAGFFTHAVDLIESIQEVTGVREVRLRRADE